MELLKLIKQHVWSDVATEFVKLYPKRENRLDTYKELYCTWQHLNPVCTDIHIYICPVRKDIDRKGEISDSLRHGMYPVIYGCCKSDGDEYRFSNCQMKFVLWEEWLGMNIMQETEQEFSPIEIICHCMRTMTYHGYSQDIIQDIKSMTGETDSRYSQEFQTMLRDEGEYYYIDKQLAKNTVNTDFLSVPLDMSGLSLSVRTGFRHIALFLIKRFFGVTTIKYLVRKYIMRKYVADTNIWGLQTQLSPFIVRCLTDYLIHARSGTARVSPHLDHSKYRREAWDYAQKEMIFAFEFLLHKNDRRFIKKHFSANNYTAEVDAKARKRAQKGFELFGIYYQTLWD
ncbi:MAG: hypothetical protein LBD76_02715 [Prevotellaceae bacterium]|jgi:hypothetical protein|nr:hypothetical protein [Prevotellaceae bacterium]